MKTVYLNILLALFVLAPSGWSQDEYIAHTVKPGETPQEIALQHLNNVRGLSVIMKVNGIEDPLSIKPGDVLLIPSSGLNEAEKMEAITRKKIELAKAMFAAKYAETDFERAMGMYKDAVKQREEGNNQQAIYKCKLANVYADRALETAKQKAKVYLDAKLVAKSGTVENSIDKGKTWQRLRMLDTTGVGSMIRTGKDANAHLEFPDKSVYELAEQTTIELKELTKNRSTGALRTSISLHDGEYLGRVQKVRNGHDNINLEASGLAILIRGTTVRLSKENNVSTLAVTEGKTTVMVPGFGPAKIEAGTGIKATEINGSYRQKVVQLPAAPAIDAKFANFLTANRQPMLAWEPPAKAEAFHFELAKTRDFASLIEKRDVANVNTAPQQALDIGVYFWRVTTRTEGLLGYSSPIQGLEIVKPIAFNIRLSGPRVKHEGETVVSPGNTVQIIPESDRITGFEYSWDGSSFQTMPERLPVLKTSGVHTLHARAISEDGSKSAEKSVTFRVDADGPEIQHFSERKGDKTLVRFMAEDIAQVKHLELQRADGTLIQHPNGFVQSFDTDKAREIHLRAIDGFGNPSPFRTFRHTPER